MLEQDIQIPVGGATAGAVLYSDDAGRPRPGVLLLTDIRGIRPANREMSARLARDGYTVLMPNAFFRTGEPPLFDPAIKAGTEPWRERFTALTAPLTGDVMEADGGDYVDYLAGLEVTSPGRLGVVGYCFTGAMALLTAAARPAKVAAAASLHGGRLWADAPGSPHLALPRVTAELYFGHAIEDAAMPPEAIQRFDAALTAWGGRYRSEVYERARHGWTVPDSAAYDPQEAERAYRQVKELLARTLQPVRFEM